MLQDVQDYITHKWSEFANSVYDILGYGEETTKDNDEITIPKEEQDIIDHVSALMFMNLQNQLTKWQVTKKHRHQLSDLLSKNPEVALKVNDTQILNDIYSQARQTVIDAYQVNPDAFNKSFDGNINTLLSV
jgi:hypothetical protein